MRAHRRIALIVGATMVAATASAQAAPMIVLYSTPETNQTIVKPGTANALPVDGRLFVQEPNVGHLFAGDADKPYRLDKVSGATLLAKGTGAGMAAYLKGRIDADNCMFSWGGAGCQSHLVFVDEIDSKFAEKAPNLNAAVWKRPKAKRPNYIPRSRPGHAGFELRKAMQILAATPYAGGGTYADRVHFYIAPGVVSSIGVGLGKHHNLGRDGKPHFRSHEGLRGALQLSGGVWLEMYHYVNGVRSPFNTREWAVFPHKFARYMSGVGQSAANPAMAGKIRFVMTRGMPALRGAAPAQCANPATPQACQFALASSAKNAPMLANGVGEYKVDGDANEWRALVKGRYFPELP